MKRTLKVLRGAALAILLAVGVATQATAAPILSIEPVTQTVQVGDPVVVDLLVSGLTELIGGFQALLSFNDTRITGVNYVIDPDGNFDNDLDLSLGFTGGAGSPLDLFMIGDPAAGQPAAFRLATISFTATALGLSPLNLSGAILSDELGNADIFPDIQHGSVCVATQGGNCAVVPEPGLIALIGTGLGAMVVRRRRGGAKSRA